MAHDQDDAASPKVSPRKKPRVASRYADASYTVGKGKPPVASQFKNGGKAGPGRPKNSRNRTPLDKLLDERVTIGEDKLGRTVRKSWREIINRQLLQLAAKSDMAAIKVVKEFEFRMAELDRRYGPPPLTAAQVLKEVEEQKLRAELEASLKKMYMDAIEFLTDLKRHDLVETVDGRRRFNAKAHRIFEIAQQEEWSLRPAADDDPSLRWED